MIVKALGLGAWALPADAEAAVAEVLVESFAKFFRLKRVRM